MFLLFKLHNQDQLLVDAARSTYIVTNEQTGHWRQQAIEATCFLDERKVLLRLLQQNTDDHKDAIVSELKNSAHLCMFAGNETRPAEFMQNILFTSGMFILLTFDIYF